MARNPKWQSLRADEVAEALSAMPEKDARDAMKQIKEGKVPGLSRKDLNKIDKDYKYKTEGKKVDLGGFAAGVSDFFKGRGTTK